LRHNITPRHAEDGLNLFNPRECKHLRIWHGFGFSYPNADNTNSKSEEPVSLFE
jgi:hypothetical protein